MEWNGINSRDNHFLVGMFYLFFCHISRIKTQELSSFNLTKVPEIDKHTWKFKYTIPMLNIQHASFFHGNINLQPLASS